MIKIKDLEVGSILRLGHEDEHEYMKGVFNHKTRRYSLMPYSEGSREMTAAGDLEVVAVVAV